MSTFDPSLEVRPMTEAAKPLDAHMEAVKFIQERYPHWDGTASGSGVTFTGCANLMREYLAAHAEAVHGDGQERTWWRGLHLTDEEITAHKAEAAPAPGLREQHDIERIKSLARPYSQPQDAREALENKK